MRDAWAELADHDPAAPLVATTPTAEARELGRHLARFVQDARAQLGTEGRPLPARCSECVFRLGTQPNGTPQTVLDATECMVKREPFLCAHRDGEPVCGGWATLMATNAGR